jgi:hypothetical protein
VYTSYPGHINADLLAKIASAIPGISLFNELFTHYGDTKHFTYPLKDDPKYNQRNILSVVTMYHHIRLVSRRRHERSERDGPQKSKVFGIPQTRAFVRTRWTCPTAK